MDVTEGDREQVKAHARAHRVLGEARAAGVVFEPHWAKREARQKEAEVKLEAAQADEARLPAMEELCRVGWEGSMAVAVVEDSWRDHPDLAAYAGGFDRFDADKKVLGPLWRKAHPRVEVPGLKKGWWTAPPKVSAAAAERARGGGRMGASSHGLRYRPAAGPSTSAAAQPHTGGLDDLVGATPPAAAPPAAAPPAAAPPAAAPPAAAPPAEE